MHNATKLAVALALAITTVAPLTASAQWTAGMPNLTYTPNTPAPSSGPEPPCEYGIGHLKRISVRQIKAIDDEWKVWIYPICEYSPNAPVRSLGNATQLIGAIGRNPTLSAALEDKRFLADDVVGVELSKDRRVRLFVHPSLY